MIQRLGHDPDDACLFGGRHGNVKSMFQEAYAQSATLITGINGQLAKYQNGNRVGLVPLLWLREKGAFNLAGCQRGETGNKPIFLVYNDIGAGGIGNFVAPGMTTKPVIEDFLSAIKAVSIIVFSNWTRGTYSCHAAFC